MMLVDLDAAYTNVKNAAELQAKWYANNRRLYAVGTWGIRVLAGIALVLATILPLSGSTDPITLLGLTFSSAAQAAVACIALAGLLVGANQVFMISTTWSRYASAMIKIGTLLKIAELDWTAQKVELSATAPLSSADIQKAFGTFKALVVGTQQVVETETSNWSADLAKALEQLQGLIKEQKSAVETLAKEEQKARETAQTLASAATSGTIRVKIEGDVGRLASPFEISAGPSTEKIEDRRTTIVLSDVVGGVHTVTLSATDAHGKPIYAEDVVQVTPNAIARVTLSVPSARP
jgi:hypothetical protein